MHDALALTPIPGAGLGIVSTAPIPPSTRVAFVPHSAMLNLSTLARFSPAAQAATALTAHARLSLALLDACAAPAHPWRDWLATLPRSFASLPLHWPPAPRALLPPSARRLLAAMQARFAADWAAALSAQPALDEARFRWAWSAVNTRSLHYPAARPDDRMTLCPYIDYFNHTAPSSGGGGGAAAACTVELTRRGYTVTTPSSRPGPISISTGEQLLVSYGSHCGDFLLVEYGFVPQDYPRSSSHPVTDGTDVDVDGVEADADGDSGDYVRLDAWMLPRLSAGGEGTEEVLCRRGYWGDYAVDARVGCCFRSETAARVACGAAGRPGDGRRWLDGVLEEVEREAAQALALLSGDLEQKEADGENRDANARQMVAARWAQIARIVRAARALGAAAGADDFS